MNVRLFSREEGRKALAMRDHLFLAPHRQSGGLIASEERPLPAPGFTCDFLLPWKLPGQEGKGGRKNNGQFTFNFCKKRRRRCTFNSCEAQPVARWQQASDGRQAGVASPLDSLWVARSVPAVCPRYVSWSTEAAGLEPNLRFFFCKNSPHAPSLLYCASPHWTLGRTGRAVAVWSPSPHSQPVTSLLACSRAHSSCSRTDALKSDPAVRCVRSWEVATRPGPLPKGKGPDPVGTAQRR